MFPHFFVYSWFCLSVESCQEMSLWYEMRQKVVLLHFNFCRPFLTQTTIFCCIEQINIDQPCLLLCPSHQISLVTKKSRHLVVRRIQVSIDRGHFPASSSEINHLKGKRMHISQGLLFTTNPAPYRQLPRPDYESTRKSLIGVALLLPTFLPSWKWSFLAFFSKYRAKG